MYFWQRVRSIFSQIGDQGQVGNVRLRGGALLAVRGFWLLGVLLALGLAAASMPNYFAALQVVCDPAHCNLGVQLSADDVQLLRTVGISLSLYALLQVLFTTLFILICTAIGLAIFLRTSDQWMGLLSSFVLIVTGVTLKEPLLAMLNSPWRSLAALVPLLGNLSGILLGYLFPGQRFAPRWMCWVYLALVPYLVADTFLPAVSNTPVASLLFLGVLFSIILVQVYRYRFVSSVTERQQTRWVVFGAAITLGADALGSLLLFFILPRYFQLSPLDYVVGENLITCCTLMFPLSLGIAIMRYHLYDIDLLIRRTLVYSLLTGSLILIYAVLIVLFQLLLNSFTSSIASLAVLSESPLLIVGTTLIVAALSQPLRRHIQKLIDRRFYRHKYDAEKTLAAFSATLRNEVDLDQLCEHLLLVVRETVQPQSMSLWLRSKTRYRSHHMRKETQTVPPSHEEKTPVSEC